MIFYAFSVHFKLQWRKAIMTPIIQMKMRYCFNFHPCDFFSLFLISLLFFQFCWIEMNRIRLDVGSDFRLQTSDCMNVTFSTLCKEPFVINIFLIGISCFLLNVLINGRDFCLPWGWYFHFWMFECMFEKLLQYSVGV